MMHAACWQKYFDDVAESERRRYRCRLDIGGFAFADNTAKILL